MSYEPTQPMQPPSTTSTVQDDVALVSVDAGSVDTDTDTDSWHRYRQPGRLGL